MMIPPTPIVSLLDHTELVIPIGERVARVEERVSNLGEDIYDIRRKVDEMHDVLMKARGARWAIISVAGFAGFLAGFIHKFLPFPIPK